MNSFLHIPAIAREEGIDINVDMFDRIPRDTPNLCSIIPAGSHEMSDVDGAGGIPAVLHRLLNMVKDSPTVNVNCVSQISTEGKVLNDDCSR